MKTKLILGPPGTGKTKTLLDIMEEEISNGIEPEKIGFVAFTKKAADEAKQRAKQKFNLPHYRLPYVRTIHSLCFMEIGAKKELMLNKKDFEKISFETGFPTTGYIDPEEGAKPDSGDFLLSLYNLSRVKMKPLLNIWSESEDIEFIKLDYFSKEYHKYKQASGKIDFTDQLEFYLKYGNPTDCKVAIVDEGQDLSKLQWKVIEKAFENANRVYIAGDDDQAIYKWSGADVNYFLSIEGEKTVLNQSYRIPQKVYNIANRVVKKISLRYDKAFSPKKETGKVDFINSIYQIDIDQSKTYHILVRNKLFFKRIKEYLMEHNILFSIKDKSICDEKEVKAIYTWENLRKNKPINSDEYEMLFGRESTKEKLNLNDFSNANYIASTPWFDALKFMPLYKRNYYRILMRNGHHLKDKPRVNLSTIHGVKGGESDHVILFTDMLYKSFKEYEEKPDTEHRVFYVGITRAIDQLTIVTPQSSMFYTI